jgi:hypothetical protein
MVVSEGCSFEHSRTLQAIGGKRKFGWLRQKDPANIQLASGSNAGVMMRVMGMLLIALFVAVMLLGGDRFGH